MVSGDDDSPSSKRRRRRRRDRSSVPLPGVPGADRVARKQHALLELARSLPRCGEVFCSPYGADPTDLALHRPPTTADLEGDYTYLRLGPAWAQAATRLRCVLLAGTAKK
eukprot:COSAG01_NODE_6400_length_3687_cov_16.465162_4_plen_110_part_00